jgi:hypothetical protein
MATLGAVTVNAGDVANMWRPLDDAETTLAETLLTKAAAILLTQSKGLLDRLTAGTTAPEAVEQALVNAVIRALQARAASIANPEGWKSGSRAVDDYRESFEWDLDRTVAGLHFTDTELHNLLPVGKTRGKAFTINTTPRH